jgi:pimeloyl-ACP methyl ester carboxylesterase
VTGKAVVGNVVAGNVVLLSAIPDSRLVIYEGAGHSPNWEQPERVAHEIDAFVHTAVEHTGAA